MSLSIRWRLTLWNSLALAIVLIGFALLIYGLVARGLYDQKDRTLRAALARLAQDDRLATQQRDRLIYWLEEFKDHDNLFAVVYAADGSMIAKTTELAASAVPSRPSAATGEARIDDEPVAVIGRQRVLTSRLRAGSDEYTVILMAPLEEVDRELSRLGTALMTTVPLAVVLSVVMGYWLARKALTPMERLRSLTEEITADRLDRRLPITNAGDEVGRLAQTINDMVARLERSFAEIRRFTADASHELRTPLTAIRAEAEVALRKPLTETEHQQLLGSILEECDRLTRLTDQLLRLAREDAGVVRFECQLVDLADLARGVGETMRPVAEARQQLFQAKVAQPLAVQGDAARLRQVFYNLLDNAIKYTPEGGNVTLALERQDELAIVRVTDSGVGIPQDHLPHVFERFYRVEKARSRSMGGTGLGLSIARSIVLAHGGQIELQSSPGQGTTCTVTLPLA